MASDSPSFIEKLRGKRTRDITLPADESKRDPKLAGYKPGALRNSLKQAGEGIKSLQDKGLIGKRSPGGKR